MRKFVILKKIRVVVSLIFFFLTIGLFLDISGLLPEKFYDSVLYLQFFPSLIKFISIGGLAAAGFIFILVLTIFFGRIYCSTICPLGTFQDIIIFFSRKLKITKKFTKTKTYNWLRYSILAITILAFFFGSVLLINLLDPFSNFGKISTNLFRPVYVGLNNLLALSLQKINSFYLYPVHYRSFNLPAFFYSIFFLGVIVLMSLKKGRLFCNTICPVGAILGLVSKVSFFKIIINKDLCNSCQRCVVSCKTGCIDIKEQKVNFSECVGCLDCISVCPSNGINFSFSSQRGSKKEDIKKPNLPKRKFIKNSMMLTLGISAFPTNKKDLQNLKLSQIPEQKKHPVTPPGSVSFEHFTKLCTACHLCVSACPTQVLQASFLEYGLGGIMQPRMDYHKEYCNFECTACGEVCPTGAILPLNVEKKKITQIGKVIFIKENCIVETDGTDCGACSEHCPTKAVTMKPHKGLFLPEVNTEICIGCGACEFACPVEPYKAIYVEGNPVHKTAQKPVSKKIDANFDDEEDFPF